MDTNKTWLPISLDYVLSKKIIHNSKVQVLTSSKIEVNIDERLLIDIMIRLRHQYMHGGIQTT